MDKREALKPGSILKVYREKGERGVAASFLISSEIGRGGSCIVYGASYEDSVGSRHGVRLKESFPYGVNLVRDERGRLYPGDEQRQAFEERQRLFAESYKKQVEIRQETGLSNITVGAFELYYGNGTVYSVMDCGEGTDYTKLGRESLKETLTRVRAVAAALWKYHQAGYLHLDIKPENVWLIPETRELVQLFDFDSVVREEDLKKAEPAEAQTYLLSFTERFAAPELAARNTRSIGQVTDIYGLGALLFYKLTGRCPARQDREYRAAYDFTELKKDNEPVRPLFFQRLEEFFHSTLAAAARLRFQTMEETIKALDELTELADTEAVYVVPNFSYHQDFFVGREKELKEIEERLGQKHLLFLHGIGGIGKTELANRYAYEQEKRYGTVLFLRTECSLEESLCRDDISLGHFAREETEDNRSYAKRKLSALKACLTEEDLLILDNFDQEDQMLEDVLELRCRILVTSRWDFSDWNYPQMEVGELEHMEELTALFANFNHLPYSHEEMGAVEDIIRLVESHTMLTELMAKNLRVSGTAPSALLGRLRQEAGTTNMEREPVRHRKDDVRRQAAVQSHLKILFDTSGLGETELSLLDNLSLFAGVRVKRDRFLEWCGAGLGGTNQAEVQTGMNEAGENKAGADEAGTNQVGTSQGEARWREAEWREALDRLVRRGWIEGGRGEDKVSLHQIVLDLIYEERKPGGKSCRVLVRSLADYAAGRPENRTERDIRDRLCAIVGRRLQGRDEETLAFYLAFCENIGSQKPWLDVCLEEYEKNEDMFKSQLARVFRLMGNREIAALDTVECVLDEKLQQAVAERAFSYYRRAIRYEEEAEAPAEYGKFLYFIGKYCNSAIETAMIDVSGAVPIYRFSLECMEKGVAVYEMAEERDNKVLTEMYDSLIDFYDPEALCLIRPEHFGDMEKRLYYAGKREEVCPSREVDSQGNVVYVIDGHQLSYTEAGEQAERAGDLEKAIRYYELAADRQEEDMVLCPDNIGYLYEKRGEYGKALGFFAKRYQEERGSWEDGDRALCMGRLYGKMGQAERGLMYIQESKAFFREKIKQDGDNGYWKGRFLQACLEMSRISAEGGSETGDRQEGLDFYMQEREAVKLERGALDFQLWWAERFAEMAGEGCMEQAAGMLTDAGQNCLEQLIFSGEMGKVLELAEKVVDKLLPGPLKVELLATCAGLVHETEAEEESKEKYFYEQTLKLLVEVGQGDTAQTVMIRWKLAWLCAFLGEESEAANYMRQCDYEVIAGRRERELKEKKNLDETRLCQEMLEVWQEGGDRYREAAGWEAGSGETVVFTGEGTVGEPEYEYGQRSRREFLSQAARCYGRAAGLWRQLEDSGKENYLYRFGRIMEGLVSVREQQEEASQAEKMMEDWHREILRISWREESVLYSVMYELRRLAELYERRFDAKQAVVCLLERGIAGLEMGREMPEDERNSRRTGESILADGENGGEAEIFFKRARRGITKEQTDMVLETCRDILRLCGQKERQELCKACREIVKRYGEEQISFK